MRVRKKLLFFDWRDISSGALEWHSRDGERHYGVEISEDLPVEEMYARSNCAYGIRLAAQPAQKIGPYRQWFGWGRIIYDEGRYRTWRLSVDGYEQFCSGCKAHQIASDVITIIAEESSDGFEWKTIGRCEINTPGQRHFDGLTFMIDPHGRPEERYKMVYTAWPPDDVYERLFADYLRRPPGYQDTRTLAGRRDCLYAVTSPDGLKWTSHPEPLMLHMSDTDTSLFFDERLGKYVMYVRIFHNGGRAVGRMESDDFWHWGPVQPILWPRLDDPPDVDVYLNGYSPYPDLPEYRLMFPNFYHRSTERSEIRLCSSEDGIAWNQVPGSPVITPSPLGEWDSEYICGGKDLVPFGEDRIAIPYAGTSYPHKYPRWPEVYRAWQQGWACWQKDRVCALKADHVGEFRTAWMLPAGRKLRLNFRTPRGGEVRVGIIGGGNAAKRRVSKIRSQGATGRSVDGCDPMHGDCTAQIVTWHGSPETLVPDGQPVSLHFKLRCAELFAVEWT